MSRPRSNPSERNEPLSPSADASPTRPPGFCFGPQCIRPRKNVPVTGLEKAEIVRPGYAVEYDFGIHPVRIQSFGFEKNIVGVLIRKLDDFIFDRWTVPRSRRLDLSTIHCGLVEVCPDQIVCLEGCVRDVAGELLLLDPLGLE